MVRLVTKVAWMYSKMGSYFFMLLMVDTWVLSAFYSAVHSSAGRTCAIRVMFQSANE